MLEVICMFLVLGVIGYNLSSPKADLFAKSWHCSEKDTILMNHNTISKNENTCPPRLFQDCFSVIR